MSNIVEINRRQFLRGAGGLMALPVLSSLPLSIAASNPISQARKRLVTVGTFLGMYPGEWHPEKGSNRIPRL
ncbi:MAG: twin-arginine translocation signal domain-containing protein, partial [Verrucomicrobiota bacterium]|nr:twin-arginine translocation signal domain-containing protein [Verrucomicrobiota bacterium]